MASSLIARRTPSISKLLKPYHPSSSSSAYACLFSQDASGNPSRELHRDPTLSSSASAVPREHPKSGAPLSPAGAAFDPIRRSLLFGGGGQGFTRAASLLDQKAWFSSLSSRLPWNSKPDLDKYKYKIERRMKSLSSKSKVLAALSLVDLLSFGWECYLTPTGSSRISEATIDRCYLFSLSVFFAAYAMRRTLKSSPKFNSWTNPDVFFIKHMLTMADFVGLFYVIMYAYLVLKSTAPLVPLL